MADCPADGEWFGVHFKLGTFMPMFQMGALRDRNDVTLPELSSRTFFLDNSAWEYPTFENVETFVHRLVKEGLILRDSCIEAALDRQGQSSVRTEQRHFLRITAMTHTTIRQIERARQATYLLGCGASIDQVVHDLSYYDQPHLNRSLRRFVGRTPAQIARKDEQLSLLYKTSK